MPITFDFLSFISFLMSISRISIDDMSQAWAPRVHVRSLILLEPHPRPLALG